MDEMKDNSVDLVVTSPPYWNARNYEKYLKNRKRNYRAKTSESYEEYLELMERCFKECYRVLGKGKFCAINVGHIMFKGKHYPIPFDLYFVLKKVGFELYEEIMWNKALYRFKRFEKGTRVIQPGKYYPNRMFEYILVFRKPGKPIYLHRTQKEKRESRIILNRFFRNETANNVWHMLPIKPYTVDHPAPFPEEIPYRLILLYSYKGEMVLDPFLGAGTTAIVAKALGRRFYGYDTEKIFIDTTKQRLKEPVYLKSLIISKFERRNKVLVRKR